MIIDTNTSIGAIIKHNPAALEAIVSLSSRFEKLRNPLLRKVIAGRASIAMATRIGGCTAEDFFAVLRPLGFKTETTAAVAPDPDPPIPDPLPDFLTDIDPGKINDLDVRPILASGEDPLRLIVGRTRSLKVGEVLKIINTFEPTPLIQLLGKQGFRSYVERLEPDRIDTYFFKETEKAVPNTPAVPPTPEERTASAVAGPPPPPRDTADWDQVLQRFSGAIHCIDVRKLEMPQPMHAILDALDNLPANTALFVYHKRIPVFLLPELQERQFDYRIREIQDGEVNLLIYRK